MGNEAAKISMELTNRNRLFVACENADAETLFRFCFYRGNQMVDQSFLQPVKPGSDSPYRLDDLRIPHIHIVISFPVVGILTAPSFFLYIYLFIIYIFLFFIYIPDLFHIFKIISFFSEFLLTFCIL